MKRLIAASKASVRLAEHVEEHNGRSRKQDTCFVCVCALARTLAIETDLLVIEPPQDQMHHVYEFVAQDAGTETKGLHLRPLCEDRGIVPREAPAFWTPQILIQSKVLAVRPEITDGPPYDQENPQDEVESILTMMMLAAA